MVTTSAKIDYIGLLETNNAFWLNIESLKLKFLSWLLSNSNNTLVQNIMTEKDVDTKLSLCANLWVKIIAYDAGCSNTNEHCYHFVLDMIDVLNKYNTHLYKSSLQQKILKLNQELLAADLALKSLETNNQSE